MTPFLSWLEATDLSTWLRESPSVLAFPTVLTLHTVSMAFLAGLVAAMNLRTLGCAAELPQSEMTRFFPVLRLSFWVSVATGLGLTLAYPTKTLTNPVFSVKLALIALSLCLLRLLSRHVLADPSLDVEREPTRVRALAALSLACWVLVIVAGRLLPYTYGQLLADVGTP